MSELSGSLDDLLYPVPADDRNFLEKTLDQLGIDQFTFYAIIGSTIIFSAITFIRFHGKGLVEQFGVSILIKITLAVLWLLNLPAAYEKALQQETAEWKASQFKGFIFCSLYNNLYWVEKMNIFIFFQFFVVSADSRGQKTGSS
jgi:hypothetical protein